MDHSKRKFLKGAAIAGGTGLFVAGYSDTLKQVASGLATGSSGQPTRDPIHGNSLAVEYRVDEQGELHPNPAQRVANTMCLGCWTLCGVRARIDNERDQIVRILGNPYHPLSARHHIDFKTPVKQALLATSGYQEGGAGRALHRLRPGQRHARAARQPAASHPLPQAAGAPWQRPLAEHPLRAAGGRGGGGGGSVWRGPG
ncbi:MULTISPECIES: hypothetical protein [Aeromonas]|uniref:hypothetical protein n=1 Tax=Aeromonas TaxID=642 RepID=UPI001FD452B4|nr:MULTISPECIES: hypothetical protein [Aeromonas]MCJ7928652.1 hypothetical protein [Aeromonas sp. LsrichE-8G]